MLPHFDRQDPEKLRAELVAAGLGDLRIEFPAPPGEQMAVAL